MNGIKSFADVALPVPIRRCFTYSIPDELRELVQVGVEVLVPFGRRRISGFVVALKEKSELPSVKPIIDIIEPIPFFSEHELEFLKRVAYLNFASLGETIRAALPTGFLVKEKISIVLECPSLFPDEPIYKKILSSLERRGVLSFSSLKRIVGAKRLYYYVGKLRALGAISVDYELSQKKAPFVRKIVRAKVRDEKEIQRIAKNLSSSSVKKKGLLYLLAEDPTKDYDYSLLRKAFGVSALQALEKEGVIDIVEEEFLRLPDSSFLSSPYVEPVLTDEQKTAVESIISTIGTFKVHLLYGVTGSGKTEVYIRVIKEALRRGYGVIYLVPEVSMIPQVWSRLKSAVEGERVAVFHSYLSEGERFDVFRAIRDGYFRLVLGVRSAVFAPVRALGLIVVDEEHSSSYKQSEPSPYYHARDVAIMRGEFLNFPVVLGSATPSVESFYKALDGEYNLLELSARVPGSSLPEVKVVDLQDERSKRKNFSLFSVELKDRMKQVLSRSEKVLLLLNRRGYSNLIQCESCGHVPKCSDCGISFTYHRVGEKLVCHWCGKEEKAPDVCPSCGGLAFRYRGRGTQRIESELREIFGDVNIFRLDRDTGSLKDGPGLILSEFAKSDKAILVGTQMISKGLDFPDVTLVGVLNADIGLSLPDFRSSERTFELLAQVAGRAGRGSKRGEVIIQTFSPDQPAIRFALEGKYHSFYIYEINERSAMNFPPFTRLILMVLSHREKENVISVAQGLKGIIENYGVEVLGPAPAPLERLRGEYRYQLLLRDNNLEKMLQVLDRIKFPSTVKVKVVVDPVEML